MSAFIDNSAEKKGKIFCGKQCIDVGWIADNSEAIVIVSPKNSEEIEEQLNHIGRKYINGETILQAYYFTPCIKEEGDLRAVTPFNHYESPYPDIIEIHEKSEEIFNKGKRVLDIEFNVNRQLELARQMESIDVIPWENDPCKKYRYYYNNDWFGKGSADVLYYMMRIIRPQRIIEVGSGFSTAVMLDTNNSCFQNEIEIHAIEPNPERLKSLLRDRDNLTIHECTLQSMPFSFFEQLQENDILFIDSSHVSKVNSDVNYYLFEIFPRIAKGVYIHFHDFFYPFIYPKEWIFEGKAYSEMYLIRAFLMNNEHYTIQFFGEMLQNELPDKLSIKLKSIAGSLWIRKEL